MLYQWTDLPFLRPHNKRWDRPTDRPGHQSRFSHQEVRKRRRCFYYCMYLSVNALKQQYFLVKMPMNVTVKSNCIFYWLLFCITYSIYEEMLHLLVILSENESDREKNKGAKKLLTSQFTTGLMRLIYPSFVSSNNIRYW